MAVKGKGEHLTILHFTNLVQKDPEPIPTQNLANGRSLSQKLETVCRPEALDAIDSLNEQYEQEYDGYFSTDPLLSRGLVSFQANKSRAVYRWYKFKEAFSAGLVEYLLARYGIEKGMVLDPFAGSGTALFASSETGLSAEGIELLPIGQRIVETKRLIERGLEPVQIRTLSKWISKAPWRKAHLREPLPELRITKGAYPEETANSISRFLTAIDDEDDPVKSILFFALLCILEVISFTRKDGQYLRWDHRSGRTWGKKIFNKGLIPSFDEAMKAKLRDIVSDFSLDAPQRQLFPQNIKPGKINLHCGSCLDLLPELPDRSYDCIITSPPYCNRYDYTRTYALELALLGIDERQLSDLRQAMLTCTVENRTKDLLEINPRWMSAIHAADQQKISPTRSDIFRRPKESRLIEQLRNSSDGQGLFL